MAGQLISFAIFGLWGENDIVIKIKDNKLIMVGENGSGKTTILRIIYETLACKWALLSTEEFLKIEITFLERETITIRKDELEGAKELFIDSDSSIVRELPIFIRRNLMDNYDTPGQGISCDQLITVLERYDYPDSEVKEIIKKKLKKFEKQNLKKYTEELSEALGCKILYLPTYRRVEKGMLYFSERDYRYRRNEVVPRGRRFNLEEQLGEIAKAGMDDVEEFIHFNLNEIRQYANISASRLNYQCFRDILNKTSDNVTYDISILSEGEIKKVFGSIDENVLSPKESSQIQNQLKKIKSTEAPQPQSYDQIVYYFYSMLHSRYVNIKEKEKTILAFFDACNNYLGNKRFVYNEKEFKYDICVGEGKKTRKISLESLSSGEKQVVSVFSYLYLSPSTELIILIDEPELSLSVPWQKQFLLDITKGSKCAGIISVTHSPFVFDNELRPFAHAIKEFIK